MTKKHLIQWLKRHKVFINIFSLEECCKVPRNTIAHAIGKEGRVLKDEYCTLIIQRLNEMVRLYLKQKGEKQ